MRLPLGWLRPKRLPDTEFAATPVAMLARCLSHTRRLRSCIVTHSRRVWGVCPGYTDVVVVNDSGKPQNFRCHITPSKKIKMGGAVFEGIMVPSLLVAFPPSTNPSRGSALVTASSTNAVLESCPHADHPDVIARPPRFGLQEALQYLKINPLEARNGGLYVSCDYISAICPIFASGTSRCP
jgi:hypothetical protein